MYNSQEQLWLYKLKALTNGSRSAKDNRHLEVFEVVLVKTQCKVMAEQYDAGYN